ncbi:FAD-binding oxidoreductase [Phenylobacterium sp. LH3H17]|uniref:NAD(P)/FAD-dependent oxidoreductase n=1 Tax=Phenylobacterium sp. LH3H17 TaxID=2903901 RepID=UPI0020C97F10|nr:FAD-binding oxidoreductase [Phenylobacterium sp. LH3H17]UTP41614.1 FAD-binding oxidoreductase [Phenylobacterium sp. LH3H17]
MTLTCDVIVIGAGIAGASIASKLADQGSVILVEAEAASSYHATGRSAASIGRGYGNATIRALTDLSMDFFLSPPAGFAEVPLTRPRPWVFVAKPEEAAGLEALLRDVPTLRRADSQEVRRRVPILGPDYLGDGAIDEGCLDVDVDALTQGYLRLLKARGGQTLYSARVQQATRRGTTWHVECGQFAIEAPLLVNAAGAWADEVSRLAGLPPLGLVPHRRTAILVDAPEGLNLADLPLTMDAGEAFYFKPEAGMIMVSPADETPSSPCDAQPDEYDVALAAHLFECATGTPVRNVRHRWAGLRTFAPDRTPVVGFDSRCDGLFWLAGQGGYGVQTAPAIASLASDLILRRPPSKAKASDLVTAMSPDRLARAIA